MDVGRSAFIRRAGLTLIEVMLALAILGIGLSVLIETASKCLSVVRQSRNYETARHLLGRVELEHMIDKEKIEKGTEEGSFNDPYSGYHWTRTIDLISKKEEEGLYSIATRVSWSERGETPYEEVVTYLYAPKTKGGTVVSP